MRWGARFGVGLPEVSRFIGDELVWGSVVFRFNAADAWGEYPPCNPPRIAGRKDGGGTGRKGLARDGARWPSGARSTQPNQSVQVAGAFRLRRGSGIRKAAQTPRRREETKGTPIGISLRLCVSASLRLNSVREAIR